MRITNKLLVKGYLADLTSNLENLKKYQEQLSSGKEIRRPSDNPFKVARSMELNTSIALNERYLTNIDEGIGWLDTTDTALSQLNNSLQRIRELTVAAGNGAYGPDERESIRQEIAQLKESIVQVGNTAYDGRYIFGGDKTTEPPFEIVKNNGVVEVKYNGSRGKLNKEYSQGVVMDIGVSGDRFINFPTGNDPVNPQGSGLFKTIDDITAKLGSGSSPSDLLGDLDKQIDNVLKLRAEVGAKSNRLDTMKSKNEEENYNMTELLAKTEDIDVAKKVMEYKVMESVYEASLQAGAKIIQPSLLDFLR